MELRKKLEKVGKDKNKERKKKNNTFYNMNPLPYSYPGETGYCIYMYKTFNFTSKILSYMNCATRPDKFP